MTPASFRFFVTLAFAWVALSGATSAVAAAPTLDCTRSGLQSVLPQAPRATQPVRFEVRFRPLCGNFGVCFSPAQHHAAAISLDGAIVGVDFYGSLAPIDKPGAVPALGGPPSFSFVTADLGALPPGTYSVVVRLHAIDEVSGATATSCPPAAFGFTVADGIAGPAEPVTVVEYYHTAMDHYFVTADSNEIAALDAGVIAGWTRTGQGWKAWAPRRSGGLGLPACRYFFHPEATSSSHFLSSSVDECDAVAARFGDVWTLETSNAWESPFPGLVDGVCPTGSSPVKRFWNNRADSNHRYVTTFDLENEMRSKGWIQEGWGNARSAMCTAP